MGAVLGDRDEVLGRVAVGCAGGGEDDAGDTLAVVGAVAGIEEPDGAGDVVAVVPQRVIDRLANVGECAEVHHGVELVLVEGIEDGGGVAQVRLDEGEAVGVLLGEHVHGRDVPAEEVIETHDMVPVIKQALAGM